MDTPELDVSQMLRTSPAIAAKFSRSTVHEGDLVYALRGKLGEVRRVRKDVAGANLTQGTARIAPREDISGDYLLWALRGSRSVRQAETDAKGTTFREITLADLRRISVPIPPTNAEQRAIAEALNDVDELLNELGWLVDKKHNLKQAALRQLLTGQTRLRGFCGKWEAKRLGDIADVQRGGVLSKSLVQASGTRPCILYGELFTTYGRVISEVIGRTNSSEGFRSISGDVLMPGSTTTTGIDLATASALLVDDVALGGDLLVTRQKKDIYDPVFLASYLTHSKKHDIAKLTQGITIHHLYGKDLKSLVLELPPLEEQTAIAEVLTDMDAELATLEQRLAKTRALKQAIMQELLTGKIRLVTPEVVHA
jgi:type I restriction enzyme, S subunit